MGGSYPFAEKQSVYSTAPADRAKFVGEAPLIQKIWVMRSNTSMPSLPGLLCPGVVAPDRVPSMGQIELLDI